MSRRVVRAMSRLLPAGALLLAATPVRSAPPEVNALFPAGAGRGQEVEVTASGTFGAWPVRVHVVGSGLEVEPGEKKGQFRVRVGADAAPGLRLLRFHDDEGASALRPFAVGLRPGTVETEPNDEPAKAQAVASLPAVLDGRLGRRNDVDGFAVTLDAGQTLVAALQAQAIGSPMDGVLQVVAPDGLVLDQVDDNPGLDPLLVFEAPTRGRYLVRVFAFPATPDSSIALAGGEAFVYRLTLTTGGFLSGTSPLAIEAGHESDAALEGLGWNLPDGDRRLSLAPTGRADRIVAWHPEWEGSVERPVVPTSVLREAPAPDREPLLLSLPASVTGRIDPPGSEDVYRVELKKGEAVRLAVAARSLNAPLDPVLVVRDAAGKVVAEQDDTRGEGRDVDLRFQAPADGTFELVVRSLNGEGGPLAAYRLDAQAARPDFALAVSSDRVVAAPGKPAKLEVAVERVEGFDQPIEVVVEGAPAGVKADAVRSEPKGDSAKKVTLTLEPEGGAAAFSGEVRIVGRAGDREPTATVATGLPDVTIDRVWLTVAGGEKKP